MVTFTTAATVCTFFVILGAVVSGAGAAHTLGKLGSINALGGSFMAAFAAALTVYWMTRLGLPVSTSQAIVGAIVGWNLFSGTITDTNTLITILATWIACPALAAVIAAPLYPLTKLALGLAKFHLLRVDAYNRAALILAGALGAYSLGANNIANVMGVFVPVSPFTEFHVVEFLTITSVQQLFLVGAVAIGVGVFTYSKKVMLTVGGNLLPLSPVAAWVVVIAHSIVLFLFASEGLENLLARNGLPTIPLVPVSSSQAVVGAVVGIGLLEGGKNIQWKMWGNIGVGWVTTPIISAVVCFVGLFFLQNVFNQPVHTEVRYALSSAVLDKAVVLGLPAEDLRDIKDREYKSAAEFRNALRDITLLSRYQVSRILKYSEIAAIKINVNKLTEKDREWLGEEHVKAVERLSGRSFHYKWQAAEALARESSDWSLLKETTSNKIYNKRVNEKLSFIYRTFAEGG